MRPENDAAPARFDPIGHAIAEGLEGDLAEAWLLLGELRGLTRWEQEVLCTRLGCDLRAANKRKEADEALAHSVAFLTWVVELANQVDLPRDARRVVIGAYELSAGASGSLADRVTRCRAAFESAEGVTFSAADYLRLGEVALAWKVATGQLAAGPAKQRADRARRLTEPLEPLRIHISPHRLRALCGSDPVDELGHKVTREMSRHLQLCSACGCEAARVRGAVTGTGVAA